MYAYDKRVLHRPIFSLGVYSEKCHTREKCVCLVYTVSIHFPADTRVIKIFQCSNKVREADLHAGFKTQRGVKVEERSSETLDLPREF